MMNRLTARLVKIWKESGNRKTLYMTERVVKRTAGLRGLKIKVHTLIKVDTRLITILRNVLGSLKAVQGDNINMESSKIAPPDSVRGMTQLSREAFTKVIKIPAVRIPKAGIHKTRHIWKPLLMKIRDVKPIADLSDDDPEKTTHCLMLLDPDKIHTDTLSDDQKVLLQNFGLDTENPDTFEIKLHYNNWTVNEILRAVMPSDYENVTSYTQVGHIAHLNLKEGNLPYKNLIGTVILDKVRSVKTVVNKLSTIDNTYRNFQMELLAGEDNYIAQIKEHNCVFELDFSKVYWNSRLAIEHQRIVDDVEKGSIVYDVFAGIGPFAVPLAKKKHCLVFANDLNPSSFEYLNKNIQLNKVEARRIEAFNLDGRDFIKTVVKRDLIDRIVKDTDKGLHKTSPQAVDNTPVEFDANVSPQLHLKTTSANTAESKTDPQSIDCSAIPRSYVVMNLPAIAIDFLDEFKSLLQDLPAELKKPDRIAPYLPNIYCYAFFPKNILVEDIRARVEKTLGQPLPGSYSVRIVRNVAPGKEMMCVTFKLWPDLVLGVCEDGKNILKEFTDSECCTEPESKKQRLSSGQ